MDTKTKRTGIEENPLAQGTGSGEAVIVYPDRVELRRGWQGQNAIIVGLKEVVNISNRGWVNCTLTIEINDGRYLSVEGMALPDAQQIKAVTERQKRMTGLEGRDEANRQPKVQSFGSGGRQKWTHTS